MQSCPDGTREKNAMQDKPVIVLIDDDETILIALKLMFKRHFNVRCFSDPVEGAVAAGAPGVAVVITDIKMPVHDGFWVFSKIRERDNQVPVIFNSAYQDAKLPNEVAMLYRPFAYITKGSAHDTLIDTVLRAAAGEAPPPGTSNKGVPRN